MRPVISQAVGIGIIGLAQHCGLNNHVPQAVIKHSVDCHDEDEMPVHVLCHCCDIIYEITIFEINFVDDKCEHKSVYKEQLLEFHSFVSGKSA